MSGRQRYSVNSFYQNNLITNLLTLNVENEALSLKTATNKGYIGKLIVKCFNFYTYYSAQLII